MPGRVRCASVFLVVMGLALGVERWAAHAGCNIIPPAVRTFPGARGVLSRPFAAPGEVLAVQLRPQCDGGAIGNDASQYAVTVAFKADAAQARLVVLATDCAPIQGRIATCPRAECRQVVENQGIGIADAPRRLWFLFPDTVGALPPDTDGTPFPGFAGPAAIAVTKLSDPLPCGLATGSCTSQSSAVACVEEFFDQSPTCSTTPTADAFTHFTALPRANVFGNECHERKPPCNTDARTELRLALDRNGNALIPMSWQGVTVGGHQEATLRLVRGAVKWDEPIGIPSNAFLASYSPDGVRLPPIFEPIFAANGQPKDVVRLFGSTDAPYSVLRVARRAGKCTGSQNQDPCSTDADCPGTGGSCQAVCVDGGQLGSPCATDAGCPSGGRCGKLFDLGGAPVRNAGPVVMKWSKPPRGCRGAPDQSCSSATQCSGGSQCARYALFAQFPVRFPAL